MMPRRTPEETLAAIAAHADDDEMESVLAMTPEERRAELRAAGFDIEAGNAKADALRAATLAASGSVTPIRRWRPRNVAMLAAAAFALFGGLIVANDRDPNVSAIPPRELLEARDLRNQAAHACAAKKLSECVDRLERARVLDPAGDKSEDAQAIHEQIEALRREQAGPGGDKPGHGSDKPGP
jgi:hypothetical protein